MSKQVYKFSPLSRLALLIADHLPNRVRAAVFIDAYESLDDHYKSITTAPEEDGSYSMFSAVDGVRINTLRREAIVDGLKGKLTDEQPR